MKMYLTKNEYQVESFEGSPAELFEFLKFLNGKESKIAEIAKPEETHVKKYRTLYNTKHMTMREYLENIPDLTLDSSKSIYKQLKREKIKVARSSVRQAIWKMLKARK